MLNAKGTYNCPNCGAPITDEKCSYCGTVFYDFSCIELGEIAYIKLKYNGNIVVCKAVAKECTIQLQPGFFAVPVLGECVSKYINTTETAQIELTFDVLSEGGRLFTSRKCI